jgi:hypothetical protein
MLALKGLSMEKWMCWGAIGVAGLLALLFILDMTPVFKPFNGMSVFLDILGILTCGVVAYLGWDAMQDLH